MQLAWVCMVTQAGWLDQMSQRGVGKPMGILECGTWDLQFVQQKKPLEFFGSVPCKAFQCCGVWADLHFEHSVLQFYWVPSNCPSQVQPTVNSYSTIIDKLAKAVHNLCGYHRLSNLDSSFSTERLAILMPQRIGLLAWLRPVIRFLQGEVVTAVECQNVKCLLDLCDFH